MTMFEVLTVILAFYAAVLSTVLMANELIAEKERVKIVIEKIAFYEQARLIIINQSKKPITIGDISMELLTHGGGESVPRNSMFHPDLRDENLHIKIGSFDSIALNFESALNDEIMQSQGNVVRIIVYTIDGHEFSRFSTRTVNPKWGSIEK